MKTTLLRMLTGLLCTLGVYADRRPMQDFDLQRMAGKWYMVGVATNAQWFVNNKAGMKMGTSMVVPTSVGDMDLTYSNLNADGTCWRMTHLAKKTSTLGQFTFTSPVWANENDMRIVDAVYDDYSLVYTIKTKNGVSENFIKLYSRSPNTSAELQRKFRDLATESGIHPENIVILPKNAECPST